MHGTAWTGGPVATSFLPTCSQPTLESRGIGDPTQRLPAHTRAPPTSLPHSASHHGSCVALSIAHATLATGLRATRQESGQPSSFRRGQERWPRPLAATRQAVRTLQRRSRARCGLHPPPCAPTASRRSMPARERAMQPQNRDLEPHHDYFSLGSALVLTHAGGGLCSSQDSCIATRSGGQD